MIEKCAKMVILSLLYINTFSANAHSDGARRDQAVIDEVCSNIGDGLAAADRVRYVTFESVIGFSCAEQILSALSLDVFIEADVATIASDTLWNIVQSAMVTDQLKPSALAMLRKLRRNRKHPLRHEAWLAHRMLAGKLSSAGGDYSTPSVVPTRATAINLLSDALADPTKLTQKYVAAHPLFRAALEQLYAQIFRRHVEQLKVQVREGRLEPRFAISSLGQAILLTSMLPRGFANTLADDAFRAFQLVDPSTSGLKGSSDNFGPMKFSLEVKACPTGDFQTQNCYLRNGFAAERLVNVNEKRERVADLETSSVAIFSLPYLTSDSVSDPGVARYRGLVQTWLRGGHAVERLPIVGTILSAQDTKAVLNYKIVGEVEIPACSNPAVCSTTLELSGFVTQTVHGDLSLEASLTTPSGKIGLGEKFRDIVVDRARGPSKLRISMERSGSHVGASGSDWRQQHFDIVLRRPSPLDKVPKILKDILKKAKKNNTNGNLPDIYEKRLNIIKGLQILFSEISVGWISNPNNKDRIPLPFGERILVREASYADRTVTDYLILLFSRLMFDISGDALLPEERDGIESASKVISMWSRSKYLGAVKEQQKAAAELVPLLDPAPFNKAIALLIEGKPVTTALDPVIATLVRQGMSDRSNERIIDVQNLIQDFAAVRNSNQTLDAIFLLHDARRRVQLSRLLAIQSVNRLTREIAQLEVEK